jgi:hypothetical protein
MISVPVLFSISFCFPPHILRLLANRRFTCMRAHILPLASRAFFAQGSAWLKKRLRVARNQLFACFPFRRLFVVPPVLCRTSPGGLKLTQIEPISNRSGLSWVPLGSPGVPSGVALGLPCASLGSPGLSWLPLASLGSPGFPWLSLGGRSGTPLGFPGLPWAPLGPLGSIWGSSARSGTPGLDLELLGTI